ncbi:MAG TPA: hypothetical protein VN085_03105, partial [Vicinamibacterales bacterium]|nr:hypothetical protein [Vicinamibacterales bacterium]
DDFPNRKMDGPIVARVARQVDAAGILIEVRDPQGFAGRVLLGEAAAEEFTRSGNAVELQRDFGTLKSHRDHLREGRGGGDANRIGFGG